MRILYGLLLILLGGLCASGLHAYEKGDFAPRGSLLYARAADLSEALKKLAGDDWKTQAERMLLVRDKRDFEESEPLINEIRKFVDYLGPTEFIIGDVMIREPFIQSATIVQLKEGAPAKFSEEFREWVKDNDRDAEIKEDSLGFEGVRIWLKAGLLIITTGGMMDVHVQDVIEGYLDESLSKVERFAKWSAKAKGDIVLFSDMAAWRMAIDRLGEDFDKDVRNALEIVEWQKWDMITGSVTLPGKTSGGLAVDLSLSLNQPFEHLNAFLKPSGGSRLVSVLPNECVGFVTAQLGRDHEATYMDLARFFHDFEQNQQPAMLRRQIEWREYDIEAMEETLARLKEELKERDKDKDKDAAEDAMPQNAPSRSRVAPVPKPESDEGDTERNLEEEIKQTEDRIESWKNGLTELRSELENFKYREFQPDAQTRKGERTNAEEFHDEMNEVLGQFGFTREEALAAVGNEALAGILNLPDPGFSDDDLDNAYEDLWFVLVETAEGWPQVKEKFLDKFMARKLPDDMDPEQKEELKRSAEKMLLKQVDGGEILRERGLSGDFCAFGGEGFVGFAANEDIALRILKSSIGQGRLGVASIPGGAVAGSKFAWGNLGAILGKIANGDYNQQREYMSFPDPYFDLEKYLPAGFHIAISSDEGSHAVNLSGRTAGEGNAANALKMFADEIWSTTAYRHDRAMLRELERALSSWQTNNIESFKKLGEAERGRFLKAVTPESLIESGGLLVKDGMRSAFDQSLSERFRAMLEAHVEAMGPAKDAADDLSEAGYEWLGLPPDLQYSDERGFFRTDDRNPWIVCQMKGDWARNGRLCIFWTHEPRMVWVTAEDLAKLREATTRGETWVPADESAVEPPKWRARKLVARKYHEMRDLYSRIRVAREKAVIEGKEFKLDFKGSEIEKAEAKLRELLGVSEEEWFQFTNAADLELKTDDTGKVTAKFEKWGQWIEIKEIVPESEFDLPYEIKTSLDEE
jgi:hypothetical protein